MNKHDFPILEHDPALDAFIEPSRVITPIDIAPDCVLCFFHDIVDLVAQKHNARVVKHLVSEMGRQPVYEIDIDGRRLAFVQPGVGAPLAAGFMEELIALGCRRFIACGGAGALASEITLGHLVVPISAVRDEGASYHYAPPSREIAPHGDAIEAIEKALQRDGVPYVKGKTWTTDAIYRETRERIARRREEGCLTVEMETSAFCAVAQFRGVKFGQILYGGDDLSSAEWDSRHWNHQTSLREKLFWLAAEACLGMA